MAVFKYLDPGERGENISFWPSSTNITSNYSKDQTDKLRGSLPKSSPLDFATKNTFPLFFVGEEALVGIY